MAQGVPLAIIVVTSAWIRLVSGQGVTVTETGGTVVTSSDVFSWFAWQRTSWNLDDNAYALSDTGAAGRASWGIADYGTQGSCAAEKLLALGNDADRVMVRNWLLNVPWGDDGKVWATEGGEHHMNWQGSFEANAEYIMLARHYAAYTGDAALYNTTAERLVCYTSAADGKQRLGGVPQRGLTNSSCTVAPSTLLAGNSGLYLEYPIAQSTVGSNSSSGAVVSHGKQVVELLNMTEAFTALLVPLLPHSTSSFWPVNITAWSFSTRLMVASLALPSLAVNASWVSVPVLGSTPAPAGMYAVVMTVDESYAGQPANAVWLTAGWLTNAYPSQGGGAIHRLYSGPLSTSIDPSTLRAPLPPSAVLALALSWQLNLAPDPDGKPGQYDVFVIRDAAYRGTNESDVSSGSAYFDLYRMGFASAYLNMRFLESLVAYVELQDGGLIASFCSGPSAGAGTCVPRSTTATALPQVAAAIGTRFGNPLIGSFVSWIGCTCLVNGSTTCLLNDTSPCLQTYDVGMVAVQALAVKLGVQAGPGTVTEAFWQAMREQARIDAGRYQTNVIAIENVTPYIWLPQTTWKAVDIDGFAIREANNTGDWHMFSGGVGDGNGAFGNQEENGGWLWSTTAMTFEANGPYTELYQDWKRIVLDLRAIASQITALNFTEPLLASDRSFLRSSMKAGDVPQTLCVAARGSGAQTKDKWGQKWCDYYKSTSFDLPEDGLLLWSFAKGMLQMEVHADGMVWLYGQPMPIGTSQTFALQDSWPTEVASLEIAGVNAGSARQLTISCDVVPSEAGVQCSVSM